MYSLETRRRRDRKRKRNLVLCHCSLCKGTYCSAKRASRHKNIFTNSTDIDSLESSSEECTLPDDAESGSAHYVSETSNPAAECEHEKHGQEDEVNNIEEYEGIFEGSGEEMYSPINSSVDNTASLSYDDPWFNSNVEDQSSSSNASTDFMIDVDLEPASAASDSDLSSLETESDVETDVRSTLLMYEGSSQTVLEMLDGYFYWFSNHPSISKNALSSLLDHEHYNVLPEGNNFPSSYEQAYDFIKPNLLPTECYHACPNDCILFRKTEPKSVDPYVEVLVDELLALCETTFYDGFREDEFLFRLQLHNYVLVYPGLNKVFFCAGSGALQGCMWCDERGEPVVNYQAGNVFGLYSKTSKLCENFSYPDKMVNNIFS